MRAPRLLRLLLALTLLVAVACGDDEAGGGDELDDEEQAYADAWARSLTDEGDGFSVDDDDADCMATAIMAELGTAPFEAAGVEPGDIGDGEQGEDDDDSPGELLGAGTISDAQADAILDAWEACTDIAAALATTAVGELDLDEESETCIAEGLREDGLAREGLKPSFTSDSDEPPAAVLSKLVELIDTCGGDGESGSSVIVDGIASELAADGNLTQEQAQCVAQEMVDVIGLERLVELGAGGGDLAQADPAVQQEIATAVLGAAEACDIPLSELGG